MRMKTGAPSARPWADEPAWKVLEVGGAGERRAHARLRQPAHALGLDLDGGPSR